jgi:hypothetical protein
MRLRENRRQAQLEETGIPERYYLGRKLRSSLGAI